MKNNDETSATLARMENRINEIHTYMFRNKSVFNVQEACIYLNIKKGTLYKMMHLNLIDYSKPMGKLAFFTKQALDEFLQRNTLKNIADIPIKSAAQTDSEAALYASQHNYIK